MKLRPVSNANNEFNLAIDEENIDFNNLGRAEREQ